MAEERAEGVQGLERIGAKPGDPRRELGRLGEEIALSHLQARGFRALARNHRTRKGEIDMILRRGRLVVFVEVKTRRISTRGSAGTSGHGRGLAAISRPLALEGLSRAQRARLRRLAVAWLHECAPRPRPAELRFDAVGVVLDQRGALVSLEHVEGAW